MMEVDPKDKRGDGSQPPKKTTAGLEAGPKKLKPLPVWFFVGIIFVIYGLIIFITGLTEIYRPPDTILSNLHPAIWWGAVITVLGAFFIYRFGPWKSHG
ncbi:MAG: hypothetical protein KGM47_06605 [Acidobacteriota bacterium]|nr:hypothetical protein [Acidobacteriota bacterium]